MLVHCTSEEVLRFDAVGSMLPCAQDGAQTRTNSFSNAVVDSGSGSAAGLNPNTYHSSASCGVSSSPPPPPPPHARRPPPSCAASLASSTGSSAPPAMSAPSAACAAPAAGCRLRDHQQQPAVSALACGPCQQRHCLPMAGLCPMPSGCGRGSSASSLHASAQCSNKAQLSAASRIPVNPEPTFVGCNIKERQQLQGAALCFLQPLP